MSQSQVPDTKLLDAMAGLDAEADLAVVQRTRRAVMEAANQMRAAQSRTRRQIGVALLGLVALLMFLTPMLWVIAEDAFSEDGWLDAPAMTALLVATVAFSIFTAILVQRRSQSRDESA
ncbi:MAG: hypothetical protein WAM66_09595 [Acidobacteriaceae bacterium]